MNDTSSRKLNVRLDARIIIGVLVLIIAGMLLVWKPWSSSVTSRTVEVVGEATVTAKPDEFVFYPSYEFANSDKNIALAELTQKSDEVVARLKALGVPENKIKTNSSGYGSSNYVSPTSEDSNTTTYRLQLTITLDNLDNAQKVQDYLVTTSPVGSVSPQAGFSDAKRKNLEDQARESAAKDARAKAEQMAKDLDFSIGKIKTLNDNTGFETMPYASNSKDMSVGSSGSRLSIQSGENELNYSVTAVYFIK